MPTTLQQTCTKKNQKKGTTKNKKHKKKLESFNKQKPNKQKDMQRNLYVERMSIEKNVC